MRWLAVLFVLIGAPAMALECRVETFEGVDYSICEVDLTQDNLRLFHANAEGQVFGGFTALRDDLARQGQKLTFATNGGMYHPDRSPVGYYLENGVEKRRLITSAGPGNFGLLPNGVFCFGNGRAAVIETLKFRDLAPDCTYATQSGPMLVIDGALHPKFSAESTSRFVRNGVGVRPDGTTAVFAISERGVTFHTFARLFRDVLGTPNALFIDGNVSRLFAEPLGRNDGGFAIGPIIGTVSAAD